VPGAGPREAVFQLAAATLASIGLTMRSLEELLKNLFGILF